MGGPKNPPANMPSREGAATRTLCHAHTDRGTLSECLFFSVYACSLLGRFGAISATLWRPRGQSPSKTNVLPTWNPVHRLMLITHHFGRTHVPPFCVTPCPSFPGGIAACAAPPLPPLPPRGLWFVRQMLRKTKRPTDNKKLSDGQFKFARKKSSAGQLIAACGK